jgi:hypothetical protein
MTTSDRLECIAAKAVNLAIMAAAVAQTPLHLYQGAKPTPFNLATLVLLSLMFMWVGWVGLLRTNNPATRYNPLSINARWRSALDGPVMDQPLDEPTSEDLSELKRRWRLRKLRKVIGPRAARDFRNGMK